MNTSAIIVSFSIAVSLMSFISLVVVGWFYYELLKKLHKLDRELRKRGYRWVSK